MTKVRWCPRQERVMVAADRKLAALASALTPRERAILQVRAWCPEEDAGGRLGRYWAPGDRAEVERVGDAISKVSNELHAFMVVWFEWLAVPETWEAYPRAGGGRHPSFARSAVAGHPGHRSSA
jgi:hypothetical protein